MKTFADYDAARRDAREQHVAALDVQKAKAIHRWRTFDLFTAAKLDTADRIAQARQEDAGEQAMSVYFLQETEGGAVKIGVTTNVQKRLISIQRGTPRTLELRATMRGNYRVESLIHELFKHARIRGEWFHPVPELLAYIGEVSERRE